MPHYTRAGDDGSTTLYGGTRVPKHHPQPSTFGAVDEASSAVGLARALAHGEKSDAIAQDIQQRFYLIMAELAVAQDKPVPEAVVTTAKDIDQLEQWAAELEQAAPPPKGFVLPGASPAGGAFDFARAVTRRAEREASRLNAEGLLRNQQVLRYLNRASSVLYDLARYEETYSGRQASRATRGGSAQAPPESPSS